MKKNIYFFVVFASIMGNAQIVINEVYGNGGKSSSTYNSNFVELKNIGTTTISRDIYIWTWLGQNSSSSADGTWLQTITLIPNQTYLVKLSCSPDCSAGNLSLPTPDKTSPIIVKGSNYNVAITYNANRPNGQNTLDRVGMGSNTSYEGSGPAPETSDGTLSISRNGSDTNNNNIDFTLGAPTPTNSNSSTLSNVEAYNNKSNLVKNTIVIDNLYFGKKTLISIYNSEGRFILSTNVYDGYALEMSNFLPGIYIVRGMGTDLITKIIKK